MNAARSNDAVYSLVKERTLHLEHEADHNPDYRGLVVSSGMLILVEYKKRNIQLYRCQDGKLLAASNKLESNPQAICLTSDKEIAVILENSRIEIMSFTSTGDTGAITQVRTLNVMTGFAYCSAVAKVKLLDKLAVSGKKSDWSLCWCLVSLKDGHVEKIHQMCRGMVSHLDSYMPVLTDVHLTTKSNIIYISCWAGHDCPDNTGVYAYGLQNPLLRMFLYQHKDLREPRGLTVGQAGFIFVCNRNPESIHQLTDKGELMNIHTLPWPSRDIFCEDHLNVLYITRWGRSKIRKCRLECSHQQVVPTEILNMDEKSIKLYEDALKDGKETVYNIRVMVVGHMGVGKTTLVKRLLREKVNISDRHSTEGIDIFINCCDVSLTTYAWTRQENDSEQEYRLQRLARVLDEKQSTRGKVPDEQTTVILPQGGTTDRIDCPKGDRILTNDDSKGTETLYHRSPGQDSGQDVLFTPSQQDESSSALDKRQLTQSESNILPMLKLLQANADKLKQDTGKNAKLTIWDFAGQYAFYTTHQTFLTRRAIYLLVSDVSEQLTDVVDDECYFDSKGIKKCKVHEMIEVWLNSIHSCSTSPNASIPPVILVGTHVDKILQTQSSAKETESDRSGAMQQSFKPPIKKQRQSSCQEICDKFFREVRTYLEDKPTRFHLIDQDFAIDNTVVDRKLEDLKTKIVEVASEQPYWGEEIPARWILLEHELMKHKAEGVKVMSRKDVENINKEGNVRIENSEELDLFLRFLHETGTIIYFSIEILRENIVLDPTWLIDALKSLINAQPSLPERPADDGYQSNSLSDSAVSQRWSDFKEKGILTLELVDAAWTKEKNPHLHAHKDHILRVMEQLEIIAKQKSFSEFGEKVEDHFLAPCMLRQESPRVVISPEQDTRLVSTPALRVVFTGKFLPTAIFHRLLAACVARWPVAKKKETSENLIFCCCCVFDLDLFHRLTLHFKNHVVFARITRMAIDDVKTPDAKLCSRVRRFITLNLSKITSYLGQNLQFELRVPFQMWLSDDAHDPDAPITPEHMNYARLCVALVTVCGKAMRDILLTNVPVSYKDIYNAILANRGSLTGRQGKALLNSAQIQLVFPDPRGHKTGKVDQFDLSLLYLLIRNISSVSAPITGWGFYPQDQPRDSSLGASVERIRFYRNNISGHSPDGRLSRQEYDDFWNMFEAVFHDIEAVTGRQVYSPELEKQKRQVISIYEAC